MERSERNSAQVNTRRPRGTIARCGWSRTMVRR